MMRLVSRCLALGVALALLALAPAALAQDPGQAVRVIKHYQKNMLWNMSAEQLLADDILAQYPDTVSLQEVSTDNRRILEMLSGAYPSRKFCYFKGIGGVAVLSRWPKVRGSGRCLAGQGVSAIQVRMPEGPVWVMSVHLEVPGSGVQTRMVRDLGPELAAMAGPKIIGGDFNAFPESGSVLDLARAANVQRIGQAFGTYPLGGFLGLPIDHVLATGGQGTILRMPFLGSDHFGVVAYFTMTM